MTKAGKVRAHANLAANRGVPGCHPEGYLPYVTEVTKEMEEYAAKRIHETPETREKCLKEMREILAEEEPTLKYREGDDFLLMFLRARNFNVRRSADMVKKYYGFLELHRDFFEKAVHPNNTKFVERFMKCNLILLLPYRDANNRAIIAGRVCTWDPDEHPPDDMIFGGMVAMKSAVEMPANQIMGYVGILDLKGFSFKQAFALFPKYLVFAVHGLQHCCPGKVQEIHVLNFPETFRVVWNVLKYLMSEKIRRRLVFHKKDGHESLHKYFSKSILPEEFGGDLKAVTNDHVWVKDIKTMQEEYAKELQYGYPVFEKKVEKDKKLSVITAIGQTLLDGLRRVSGDSASEMK